MDDFFFLLDVLIRDCGRFLTTKYMRTADRTLSTKFSASRGRKAAVNKLLPACLSQRMATSCAPPVNPPNRPMAIIVPIDGQRMAKIAPDVSAVDKRYPFF